MLPITIACFVLPGKSWQALVVQWNEMWRILQWHIHIQAAIDTISMNTNKHTCKSWEVFFFLTKQCISTMLFFCIVCKIKQWWSTALFSELFKKKRLKKIKLKECYSAEYLYSCHKHTHTHTHTSIPFMKGE